MVVTKILNIEGGLAHFAGCCVGEVGLLAGTIFPNPDLKGLWKGERERERERENEFEEKERRSGLKGVMVMHTYIES